MMKRQQVLADFGHLALRSGNLDEILTEACRLVGQALGTDRARILEIQDGGSELLVRAGVGWDPGIVGHQRLHVGERSSETYSIREGKPVVSQNLREDDRFDPSDLMARAGVVALVNVPIFVPGLTPYGLLQVDASEPRDFGPEDIAFLRTYATILGPVIDRLQKVRSLRASDERFRIIVETARDYAIYTTDAHDRIDAWFAGAEAVFGWTAEEAIGQLGSIVFTPEDRATRQDEKEIETARRDGSAPNIRWHLRKDGGRVFIEGAVRALCDDSGAVQGFVKIGQDVTRRREADERLRSTEARQRALVEGVPQLVWRAVTGGHWTWSSPQWSTFTGLSEEDSRGLGWLGTLHEDDREAALASWQAAEASGRLEMEVRIWHAPERRHRWFTTRATPVRNASGHIAEWLGTSTDVDDLRSSQERQNVLVAELQHRTRNLIAIVRSLFGETMRRSETLESFEAQFKERLAALARVQGLLSQADQNRVTIGVLLRTELDALGSRDAEERVTLGGPDVPLRNSVVQTLALAIHELATNARKYGALAPHRGRLDVSWAVYKDEQDRRRLALTWAESDVAVMPDEASGKRVGYGRELIEKALPYALSGRTTYVMAADGVRCTIDLPLDKRSNQA
jgi:PAS domain S-box-containing protein